LAAQSGDNALTGLSGPDDDEVAHDLSSGRETR